MAIMFDKVAVETKDVVLISVTEYSMILMDTKDVIVEALRKQFNDETKCVIIVPDRCCGVHVDNTYLILDCVSSDGAAARVEGAFERDIFKKGSKYYFSHNGKHIYTLVKSK